MTFLQQYAIMQLLKKCINGGDSMLQINWQNISGEYYDYTKTWQPEVPYNFDYSRTLTMKMFMARQDGNGGSKVYCRCEEALEVIKRVDAITRGIPKIIYLIGWQYCGHDDKYPAMDEVNVHLKRPQDATARDSLLWLMEEAYKYNTTVSLHINLRDSYTDSPLWKEYVDNGLIGRTEDGSLFEIGTWAGKTSYQIDYKAEWESGYLQKRIGRLMELLPIQKAGTIHVDAYHCREFAGTTLDEQRQYRRKAIRYFRALGVDVTTEFIYSHPNFDRGALPEELAASQKEDLVGLVPMIWHYNPPKEWYITHPRQLICGGHYNPDLDPKHEDTMGFLGGDSIYGEGSFMMYRDQDPKKWEQAFIRDFVLGVPAWYWQNQMHLLEFRGEGDEMEAVYEQNYLVSAKNRVITQNGYFLREGGDVFMPLMWQKGEYIAYSENGYENREWHWDGGAEFCCFVLTDEGWQKAENRVVYSDGCLTLSLQPLEVLLICEE